MRAGGLETGEKEGERRKEKKEKKKRKGKGKKRRREKERKKEKRSPAGFAAGGRAWATGSRAARDGTTVRKKRERARFGRRKREKKRWNDDWDGKNFLVRVK